MDKKEQRKQKRKALWNLLKLWFQTNHKYFASAVLGSIAGICFAKQSRVISKGGTDIASELTRELFDKAGDSQRKARAYTRASIDDIAEVERIIREL